MTTSHKDGLVGILAPDGQSYLNNGNKSLLDKMGLFFKKERGEIAKSVDNHFNPERRNFFSKAIKTTVVGLAAMAGANGIIKTASYLMEQNPSMKKTEAIRIARNALSEFENGATEALTGKDAYAKEADWLRELEADWKRKLPPGIQIAAPAQKCAWSDIQDGAPDWATDYIFPGVSNKINMRFAPKLEYFKTEPAVYLCLAFADFGPFDIMGVATDKTTGNLSEMDPMAQWAKGISNYHGCWVQHEAGDEFTETPYNTPIGLRNAIEIPFLNAIFYSANRSTGQERVEQYLSGKVDRRALLNNTMKDLKKAGHIDQLVAAWASTWLTNHLWNQSKNNTDVFHKEMISINSEIEVPLRKYAGRIRAEKNGPYYYGKRI